MTSEFDTAFKHLTGNLPLSWQTRLYENHFAKGDFPGVIDIATGLGKTMVMAIWLIARSKYPEKVPTRLIYVVDRRTVVDQATDLAKRLQSNFGTDELAISTLRGQLADNRDWSRDPSRPSIIIGTVDLIGSALLFSGYRSSYKRRPLEAGLLGQDSLLVLDEAHLSKPFEKLICAINDGGRFQKDRDGKLHGAPMKVIRMSATSGQSVAEKPPFTLQFDASGNLTGEDAKDKITCERFNAEKRLTIMESKDTIDSIATEAGNIAINNPGSRIVIFVKSPKDVDAVRKALIKKDASRERKIAQLTGTMRGLERDELVDTEKPLGEKDHERRVMQRFLNPENDPSHGECFLISTSAGEVGFDLNADHLIGDEAPLDSWIQRLGRVNRRGYGKATVILVRASKSAGKSDFENACISATELLSDRLDGENISPQALAAFKATLSAKEIEEASSPKPTTVDLTDILLDAWSLTSITEQMPGRPEVGPWLRGIADELPQTTIAWRAELDEPGFANLNLNEIVEWFDTHRILTHETLSVPTSVAAKWFTERWGQIEDDLKSKVGSRSIVVDQSGLKLVTVRDVLDQLDRKNSSSIRYANIILPASFGGIERKIGLLDAKAPQKPMDTTGADSPAQVMLIAPDVADVAHGIQRFRQIVTTTQEGETETRVIGGETKPSKLPILRLELESDDAKTVRLASYVPKREKLEFGSEKQTLQQHVVAVCNELSKIIRDLNRSNPRLLSADFKLAAELAAEYHDHGKNRERWQRTAGGTATASSTDWRQQNKLEVNGNHQCLGKSGGEMKRDPRGYRHEFGSLREFTDSFNEKSLIDDSGNPISQDVFDLAMHLIATHHGRGRPHFPKGGFDPDNESRSEEIHTESIRRFARLQRKHGWWHLAWLENLLRCADALASADRDAEDDTTGTKGDI